MKKYIISLALISISIFMFLSAASATDDPNINDVANLNSSQDLGDYSANESLQGSNSTNSSADEILVRFKYNNLTNAEIDEISKNAHLQTGATLIKSFEDIKGLQLVKIPENISLTDVIVKYTQNPDVLYVEPNYMYKKETVPNDAYYNDLWGLSKINAPAAWDITTGSSNVIIAVIDSGVDILHPDLINNIWTNAAELYGLSGVDDDQNGYIDDIYGWNFYGGNNNVTDDNGHGTHVAGIIAACGNNTEGITGVMWNAKIMPLKFLDENGYGYMEDAVDAISYATKMGAVIINCSWGGDYYSQALKDIIDVSSALVVCAAGNEVFGLSNDVSPVYPASFTSDNIISVAAAYQDDSIAYFSNYGVNSVDVAAPGSGIYSTLPRSQYDYMRGTSMATPYVSGLAGLIKSIRPDLNSLQIKYTILSNVDYISSLSGKLLTGGRINAFKALTNIITDTTAPTASSDLKGGSYYYLPVPVSLTASEPGNIYYTIDGTIPTAGSLLYRSPITLYTSQTIKFIAIDSSGIRSPVYTENYLLYKLTNYSYQVYVPYKKSKKKYKVWYKVKYKYKGKWRYKWKYKRVYKRYYRWETRYGQKYELT